MKGSSELWVFQGEWVNNYYFGGLQASSLCENHKGWLTLPQTLTFVPSKWRPFWQATYFSGQ